MKTMLLVWTTAVAALLVRDDSAAYAAPLDDFVALPDAEYGWTELYNFSGDGFTAYTLNLTSLRWGHFPEQFVEPQYQVWWHYLTIVVPDVLESTSLASLNIYSGSSTSPQPSAEDRQIKFVIDVAVSTGLISAVVENVPFEPVRYSSDPDTDLAADPLMAQGWVAFIDDENAPKERLARFPMTKASVRAMDAVAEFISEQPAGHNLTEFFVSGASKRGWTTWLVAAVDPRVVACAPFVIDGLGLAESLKLHYRSMGGAYSFGWIAYLSAGITSRLDEPRMAELESLVDPLAFVDRYTFPILIVTASSDQLFMPDNTRLWSDQFADKELFQRALPNCDHVLNTGDCTQRLTSSVIAFLNTITQPEAAELPEFSQEISQSGESITIRPQSPVLSARVWTADSADFGRRDFRPQRLFLFIPIEQNTTWFSTELTPNTLGEYMAEVDAPEDGTWRAFFIEVEFGGGGGDAPSQVYTSEVSIVPDTFPAEDCFAGGCTGGLFPV